MKVPYLDLEVQYEATREEVDAALRHNNWYRMDWPATALPQPKSFWSLARHA